MTDKGSHYRYTYKGIKLDPYRVCEIYNIGGGPREHMTKKLLRGPAKGHSEQELIDELQCCLDRWKEMVLEDTTTTINIGPGNAGIDFGTIEEVIERSKY